MCSPQEACQQGIAAGREWFDAVVKPFMLRLAASGDAQVVAAEMEAAVGREIPQRIRAGGQDLLQAGLSREKVEEWVKGVALGAGWRAKELEAQLGAAND